jgi:hypothetical protein
MCDELTPWREARCLWCGELLPVDRDPRRKFCDNGRACGNAHSNDLRAARYLLARMDRTCAHCGATFTRQTSKAIYCSRACAVTASNRAAYERKKARTRLQTTD